MERPLKTRRFDRDVDGILLLDKPAGLSSNAALQAARVHFRALKAGHAGSLDPLATGMLPVCFGQATKVCAFLLDAHKTYRLTAKLGERTDTADADGSVIERAPIPALSEATLVGVLNSFLGEQQQVPPMYSALKHQGKRLYELARRGESVERDSRRIYIESIKLNGFIPDHFDVTVRCSKGTYVRTLAEDIAKRLGTFAHLTALRRQDVDPFTGRRMYALDELASIDSLADLDRLLMTADAALPQFPAVTLDAAAEIGVLQGKAVPIEGQPPAGLLIRLYGPSHGFIGVGETVPNGAVQPRRLLVKSSINP